MPREGGSDLRSAGYLYAYALVYETEATAS